MSNHLIVHCGGTAGEVSLAEATSTAAALRRSDGPSPPQPLDSTGALATLLAVIGTVSVEDAANAVGLTVDDLVYEAEAWAAFSPPLD